jgi:hypothetical protein
MKYLYNLRRNKHIIWVIVEAFNSTCGVVNIFLKYCFYIILKYFPLIKNISKHHDCFYEGVFNLILLIQAAVLGKMFWADSRFL